jgi:PRTRC genetic system protein C
MSLILTFCVTYSGTNVINSGILQAKDNMAIKVEKMTREFVFNGIKLPDPNPELTVEKVREIHAMTYPEISTAAVEGPEPVGNRLRYTFSRAVGTKG